MITDALVNFIGNTPMSIVGGAGIAIPSTNVIDLLGQGVGTAPQNIIGNRTVFGEDAGIGGKRAQVEVIMTTGAVTGNAATLNVQFQGAADDPNTHQPVLWRTLVETGAIAVADLPIEAILARFDFPPAFPVNFQPRYLRLLFTPAAATNFSAGAVLAPVTMVRDDLANKYGAPRNYAVA